MPVQAVWDNEEHTTIRYVIEGDWTWDEMNAAVATSNAWLDELDRKVDFIHDMSRGTGVPSGAITQLRRYMGKEHPNTGRSVVIAAKKSLANSVAQGILDTVQKIYRRDWGFMFADSLEEARQRLAEAARTNDPE
jgi:hypothetical protein